MSHPPSCLSNQSSQTRKGFQALEIGDFRKGMGLPCGLLLEPVTGLWALQLGPAPAPSFPRPHPWANLNLDFQFRYPSLQTSPGEPHSPRAKTLGLQPGTDHRGLRARAELGLRGAGSQGYPAGTRTALRQARLQLLIDTEHLGEFLCRRETVKGGSAHSGFWGERAGSL